MRPTDEIVTTVRSVLAHHMMETGDVPVLVLNERSTVILASRSAGIFGWSLAALVGKTWDELVHPDDAWTLDASLPAGLDRRFAGVSRSVRVRNADGTWRAMWATSYSTWASHAGTTTVVVLRDAG